MHLGAFYKQGGHCEFTVWAPLKDKLAVKISAPEQKTIPLRKDPQGYWHGTIEEVSPDLRYLYEIDGKDQWPDPASFFQPEGVHKPSGIIDHSSYAWGDETWQSLPLNEMIIYEIHVGTFTDQGTFAGIISKLDYLKSLGVNTIEIMPVAQFPGNRNWGYDGVHPFAVQNTYGGPTGFKQLIDACHQNGIAVVLDVVYNHLGPEGNYLGNFAPYFTDKYQTPWGWAINFDDHYCDGTRNYFIQNVLYWFEHFHIDGLRLDAIHGIFDFGAKHILKEMAEAVEAFDKTSRRKHYLIAESDLNDIRVIEPREKGGHALDAQWMDDFHHALRTLLTEDRKGYYADFGKIDQLAKSYKEGFVYDWTYSRHRKKYFGSSSAQVEPDQFVIFSQNHDQVGNRMQGERLSQLVDFESQKLAAAAVLLSPYIPMLFMGEEFGAQTPFQYFISHLDPDLVKAVREGRKREFAAFQWQGDPPDPQDEKTFTRCRLDWNALKEKKAACLFAFYQELIHIRKTLPCLRTLTRKGIQVSCDAAKSLIWLKRGETTRDQVLLILHFGEKETLISDSDIIEPLNKLMDSSDARWLGPGSQASEVLSAGTDMRLQPRSFVLYGTEPFCQGGTHE